MAHTHPTFAAWVKASRQAHYMTQDALAEHVGCSRMTIAKIEAGDRRPSHQLADLLAATLKISTTDRDDFLRLARLQPAAPPTPRGTLPPHILPIPLTSFIGRTAEVASVLRLLATSRWLTIRGPAGIGKTRLALHVAQGLLSSFPDGVFFVELVSLRDPALVVPLLARTLGLEEPNTESAVADLVAVLRPKRLLLLLDNFEHVAPAAPLIAAVLSACPSLTVLVTSREALHVQGEQQYLVPPLIVPDLSTSPSLAACDTPAVALFVARAQALQPDFILTTENAAAVAGICARLEGLPLAIELAAARSHVLSPGALLALLGQPLDLLTDGAVDLPIRHQTLRDAIGWSYDLLTPTEQLVFRRIGVFVGGMTLEAVNAVIGGLDAKNAAQTSGFPAPCLLSTGLSVLDGLASLINKSLLRRETDESDQLRYTMLETIREYALEQLAVSGEDGAVRRVHAVFFLGLAEQLAPEVVGSHEGARNEGLERDHDNLLAALAWWSTDPDGEGSLVRLTAALGRFWFRRGYWSEGRTRLGAVLNITAGPASARAMVLFWLGSLVQRQGDYPAARRYLEQTLAFATMAEETLVMAHALNGLGNVARQQGDYTAAVDLYEQALACYRVIGDKKGSGRSLNNLGMMSVFQGDYRQARVVLEEGLATRRELGYKRGVASSLNNLGDLARAEGNYAEAERVYEECLALVQELADKPLSTMVLFNMGHVALDQGDYTRARSLFCEALPLYQVLGGEGWVVLGLVGFAAVGAAQGQPAYAARLSGAVASLLEDTGTPLEPQDRATYERTVASLHTQLDSAAFTAAWAAGRAMTAEQVIAYAVEEALAA